MITKALIMPVGMSCNLRCGYCINNNQRDFCEKKINVMNEDTLVRIFSQLAAINETNDPLEIIWHGGEPTLAGLEFYRMAIKLERKIFLNREVRNGIQTNATLVNDEWCIFFKEANFRPSVSMDGPKRLHNKLRINSENKGTYEKVIDGYNLMKSYGLRMGSLGVVTPHNVFYPEEIIDWLIANDIRSWDFLFATETPEIETGLNPDIEEAKNFAIKMFSYWFKKNNPNTKIRTFRTMMKSLVGGTPSVCSWKSGCLGFISFDINGDAYLCAKFHAYPETSYGNIMEQPLKEMIETPKVRAMHEEIERGQESCLGCKWLKGCGGGCPFVKYAFHKSFTAPFEHCNIRSKLFQHIKETITLHT